ncbi:MAG TPA: hypothetical protein PLG21_04930 [Anaerolineae bacterium]|nr:hypothetical protein [Anaerolineae bacterium]
MLARLLRGVKYHWPVLLGLAVLAGYWLLPISGQVVVTLGSERPAPAWPQMRLEGATLQVSDDVPWAHVLVTVNGAAVYPEKWWQNPDGSWTWQWTLSTQAAGGAAITFYHDCHTGCVERGRLAIGPLPTPQPAAPLPTKLGVAFADPLRDWHGRAGWDVELAYCRPDEQPYWSIDELAARVYAALAKGLRVLVRVDYAPGQSLPPGGDYAGLSEYVAYAERLARDVRLQGVYGYVIGSGYNAHDANALAPEQPVTPAWYARVFSGYGEAATRTDNVVQALRAANPVVRVLVGPVRPWVADQGDPPAPWLGYMNSLVAALDEAARTKAAAGIPLAAPDGFALQAPGRPAAAELTGRSGAEEPRLDLKRASWQGAQAGFRVYRDWLAIINAYPATRGLPAYITSSNTYAPDDGAPPAQNYPRGWLSAALAEADAEPQVQALVWFLDGPLGDAQWDGFSLARRQGHAAEAADEFDALLKLE